MTDAQLWQFVVYLFASIGAIAVITLAIVGFGEIVNRDNLKMKEKRE